MTRTTVRLTKMAYRLERCDECLADCSPGKGLANFCTACLHDRRANRKFATLIENNDLTDMRFTLRVLTAARPLCPGYAIKACGQPPVPGYGYCYDCLADASEEASRTGQA